MHEFIVDKTPIKIHGEIETTNTPDGNLTINFPKIKQKYFIDIHPIE